MQTFLPYPDFKKSAKCLDWRRLGKQRVEAYQILRILCGVNEGNGWVNHPAVRMWEGYEWALFDYICEICLEWIEVRGYKDTIYDKIDLLPIPGDPNLAINLNLPMPPWFGDASFHASHRSNLLRKDPEWYGQFGWTEPNDLAYVWPV